MQYLGRRKRGGEQVVGLRVHAQGYVAVSALNVRVGVPLGPAHQYQPPVSLRLWNVKVEHIMIIYS